MVVRKREVVDGTNDDLAVFDDRPVLGGMHAKDRGLGRVDNRGREHRAEHATVGYRERAASHFLNAQLAFAGALAEICDGLLDFGNRQLLCVSQDRHDQATRAAHGNADIKVAVVDDVLAVD